MCFTATIDYLRYSLRGSPGTFRPNRPEEKCTSTYAVNSYVISPSLVYHPSLLLLKLQGNGPAQTLKEREITNTTECILMFQTVCVTNNLQKRPAIITSSSFRIRTHSRY